MTLADEINRMILKIVESLEITSAGGASPNINTVIQANETEKPDLEALIQKGADDDTAKESKQINLTLKKVEKWDKGNIGEINRFTSQQIGNLREFVSNPAGFVISTVFRKFAKGLGVIAFALIIFEAVKFIITELLKPGRLLDIRFKRDIRDEIIAFRKREDQQKLKQGFSSIIITTQPGLRGGQGQAFNTLRAVADRDTQVFENIGLDPIIDQAAGMDLSKSHGRRTFRGGGR